MGSGGKSAEMSGRRSPSLPPAPGARPPTLYARLARWLADATGSPVAAGILVVAFVVWLFVGVSTDYPRWWELVITVGFPFLTLGLLIVIQHTQTHGNQALHLKLDEIIGAQQGASDDVLQAEQASAEDLEEYRRQQTARVSR
jgi:low affinity Fe/Cu permease